MSHASDSGFPGSKWTKTLSDRIAALDHAKLRAPCVPTTRVFLDVEVCAVVPKWWQDHKSISVIVD